jgi:heme/copper-type cytochrome/quinol oxidase subunit 2
MQMKIVVESQEDYDAWLEEQQTVQEQGIFADADGDTKTSEKEALLAAVK